MSVNLWLIAFLTANHWCSLSCSWCKPLFVHKQYAAGSPPSTWNLGDLSVCFFCLQYAAGSPPSTWNLGDLSVCFFCLQYAAGSPPSTWNLEDLSVCFFCSPTIASMAGLLFGFPSGSEVQVGLD